MNKARLIVIALASVCVLALGILALASRQTDPAPANGPVIIIKGGSLTIECGDTKPCLDDLGNGKYSHVDKDKKITQIVVKDDVDPQKAKILRTFDKSMFPNGKPQIEITYK